MISSTPIDTQPPSNISSQTTSAPQPRLQRLEHLLDVWKDDAQAAYYARVNKLPRGPMSGWASLDREIGGCFSPGVHIMHGQPGAGKTAFAL